MKFFIVCLALGFSLVKDAKTAPTLPSPDTVSRLVEAASDDLTQIAVAKAAAVGFAGGVAINTISNAVPNVTFIYKTVADSGNAALKTMSDGGNTALQNTYEAGEHTMNYLRDVGENAASVVGENVEAIRHGYNNVDPIQVINETESAVLLKNKAVLKAVFDAKRKAYLALKDLSKITTNFTVGAIDTTSQNVEALLNNTALQVELMNTGLQNFWNTTLSNLNLALTNAQSNIQASKETIAMIYNNMTMANAQLLTNWTLVNAGNAATGAADTISDGIDTTITITGNATSSVLNSLVEAKSEIHEAAENFDSKSVISKTKKRIGNAIVQTFEGAGNLLEQAGVYDAIDSIVHGFAGLPLKTNNVLEQAEDTVVDASIALRDMWEDDKSEDTENLKRSKLSIKTLMDNEESNDFYTIAEKLEPEDEVEIIEEDTKPFDETRYFDDTEKEIETVEDEVEEIEDDSYPEEFDAEKQIKTKTQEIMQLMETINDNNNEIVR